MTAAAEHSVVPRPFQPVIFPAVIGSWGSSSTTDPRVLDACCCHLLAPAPRPAVAAASPAPGIEPPREIWA